MIRKHPSGREVTLTEESKASRRSRILQKKQKPEDSNLLKQWTQIP
jgi:hypothetical protein